MGSVSIKRRIDATEGPIFSKMVYFVIPLMLTNLIQQLYTVADNLVVGKFSPSAAALGAIGSSSAIVAFLTALFASFSVGTAAVVSHDFGARDSASMEKDVHTSMILSFIVGLSVGVIGFAFARPILVALNTKPEFIDLAVVYLQIRCIGMPFVSLYNIGAATLRSVGDSKSPLYILTLSGLVNVILNLVFVLCFGMAADGVALATLASQVLSVVFVYMLLIKRTNEPYAVKLSSLKIDKTTAKRILKFAIPGAIQGSVAHVMNVFLASAANVFDPEVIEARTIASNIDTMLSTVLATYVNVSITFTGQNKGAKKPDRIKKSLFMAVAQGCAIALVFGQLILHLRAPLISLFVNEELYNVDAITGYASTIMGIILTSYVITGVSNALGGFIKGLGYALPNMVVSLVDMGIVRAIWIFGIFPSIQTLEFLYLIYPVSWALSSVSYIAISLVVWKKYKKKIEAEKASATEAA